MTNENRRVWRVQRGRVCEKLHRPDWGGFPEYRKVLTGGKRLGSLGVWKDGASTVFFLSEYPCWDADHCSFLQVRVLVALDPTVVSITYGTGDQAMR